jgi:hypothetical protein
MYAAMAGTALTALGALKEGRQANADASFQAAQLEQNAGQERAASQRQAIEQRRQARLTNSRIQALAGGGGLDPTVVDLSANIAGEGELRALTALYTGEERARGNEMNAQGARIAGKNAERASRVKAISSVLSSGSSMFEKYGGGGAKKGKE